MTQTTNHELILILDFGSQYTQLIARRIRELGVYCEIVPYNYPVEKIAERAPRGVYSGAIGYLSYNGAADLSIAIRTIIATPSATGSLFTIGTGGAIVALSDADAEFEETLVKARAQIAAVLAAATSAPPGIIDRVIDGLRES